MPALSKRLRDPRTWLALLVVLAALAALDACAAPENQVTARLYIRCVEAYQSAVRPALAGHVACRFHPSCSDYSIACVRTAGIARGTSLTVQRILRCQHDVAPCTLDPPPLR